LDASPTLFTTPNADPGGSMIAQLIGDFVSAHAWAKMIDTLGTDVYANAMRHAAVMVGNSSSGLIEAGLFDLPVVNVGDRQAGREHGDNVVTVPADAGAIVAAVNGFRHRPRRKRGTTPYGDGQAVERVLAVIKSLPERQVLLRKQWPADERADAVDRSVRAKAAR
jgi:UDP-N-acetylglucosamine 2-epimerase